MKKIRENNQEDFWTGCGSAAELLNGAQLPESNKLPKGLYRWVILESIKQLKKSFQKIQR